MKKSLYYILTGTVFGIIMYKSEAASWFRIYEMFQFESFHMYGIIGSAVAIGLAGVQYIKRTKARDFQGEPIEIAPKEKGVYRTVFGGALFGLGWGLSGACPGPMYTLAGAGYWPILIVLASAVLGTFVYGLLKPRLPH